MGTLLRATSKAADAPDVEPGLYDARFEGLTTKFIEGGQYGDGDRYVWEFTLLDDDGAVLYDNGDPITIDALTSMSLNIASKTQPKAVRYLKALLNAAEFSEFENDGDVDADGLVGRTCQVDVAIRDSGWPTIVNVLPARRARRSSAGSA